MSNYQFDPLWDDENQKIFRLKLEIYKTERKNPELVFIMLNPGSFGQNGNTENPDPTLREIEKVMETKGIENAIVYNLYNLVNGNKTEFLKKLSENLDNEFMFFEVDKFIDDCKDATYIIPAWGVLENKKIQERGIEVMNLISEKFRSKILGIKKTNEKENISYFHPRLMYYNGIRNGVGIWKTEILKLMK